MSDQIEYDKEATLLHHKMEAFVALYKIRELTPDDPYTVSTLKKFEWDIISYDMMTPREVKEITINGTTYILRCIGQSLTLETKH